MVRSITPYDLLFPQNGSEVHPLVISRISYGHISAKGDLIHFMFGSSVRFSESALGRSNGAISGSIKSRIAAGRHLEKLQRHRTVSLRQRGFLVNIVIDVPDIAPLLTIMSITYKNTTKHVTSMHHSG